MQVIGVVGGRVHLRGDDVSDDLSLQVGKIVQRMSIPSLSEIDEPDKAARSDEDILQIQVTMNGRLRASHILSEQAWQAGQRVWQRFLSDHRVMF